jgi:hypothetical protein
MIDYGTGVSEPAGTFGVTAFRPVEIDIRRIPKVPQVIYYEGFWRPL